jgi:tetratricopeptide (TPR) repeat protein/tRNA A-37 threonylcarbamoyl transferase component Bud32
MTAPLPSLGDRFTVWRELGRGGMATVYLAHDTVLGRQVAVKLVAPAFAPLLSAERFEQEIRLTARLVHPSIVPLFGTGRAGDQLFYVMPFIEGETLRARLERGGTLGWDEVVRLGSDVAEALAYAHGQGLIHRDIKPENIFCQGGRAIVADFGIARALAGVEGAMTRVSRMTEPGLIIGTAMYMSPEQALGDPSIDARSDLYSLGCVLYELLTGVPPHAAPTAMAVVARRLTQPAPSVLERCPGIPGHVARAIDRLLAREPDDRPASASEFLEALRQAAAGVEPVALREPVAASAPVAAYRPADAAAAEAFERGRRFFQRGSHGGEAGRDKLQLAVLYLERARDLVPDDAHVLAVLADAITIQGLRGYRPSDEATRLARELRFRAIAADDSAGEAHTSLGAGFLYFDDDFAGAGEELRRGAELAPANPMSHRHWGSWLKIAGRLDEALTAMTRASRLDPGAPFTAVGVADVLMAMGRYNEALGPLRDALRLDPRYDAALERLEVACDRSGQPDEALAVRRSRLGFRGLAERLTELDADAAALGPAVARTRDLERELEELLATAQREDPFADQGTRQASDRIIIVLAELGRWTEAMDWVEQAYHRRPGRLRRVLCDLPFDRRGLAPDPRYARLLRTGGLDELL